MLIDNFHIILKFPKQWVLCLFVWVFLMLRSHMDMLIQIILLKKSNFVIKLGLS